MDRVRSSAHADSLWHGQIVCRQYIQGYCSYGSKCKYNHPPVGERWPGTRSHPLTSQANYNTGYWPSSQNTHSNARIENQYSDVPQPQQQYSAAGRLLGNDPKKIRSIIAWKTTPCKHFVKNNGWCPLGDACNFIHDWQLIHSTMWNRDIIRQTAESSSRPDGTQKATSHCWAHVQGFCGARNCPHFHPADIQPYVKYTPCPAWILCDRRSTCPFKHFDALSPASQDSEPITAPPPPPPPPPPQIYYPPPPPPPPPVAYTPPTLPVPNPVELNGTTYFPIAHDTPLPEEFQYSMLSEPVPVPLPIATTVHIPPHPPLNEPIIPPASPPPSYHHVPLVFQPRALERAYVTEPSPPPIALPFAFMSNPTVAQEEDFSLIHQNPLPAGTEYEPTAGSLPILAQEPQPKVMAPDSKSADSDLVPENQRRKRRPNGHARRISINVKTGEVVERALEGRHGVYGL
ncbi:hypothetical protein P691DRAFT_777850 [Macrolepiota fuliginosa MF-IS2]|uniref:C3H1-type domain-containing protein n=1 Tax=Macrolepiota fuliginosa MF-IS2 TaxID=1400762 RepID=A0A9P5X5P8_9AGAR|nr:hypothetical protein P691DRAFT_777850 [Macrolepiota fuliginosa MF-IS2]